MEGVSWSLRQGLGLVLVHGLGVGTGACAEPPAVGSGWSTSMDSTAAESTGPGGPPEVIDVGLDVLVLREGEAVVITAVVVDPDDDVREGELLGPGEPVLYGAMEQDQSDRWRATVRWSDVHERWPLSFERELELPFTVRLVDAQGHEAEGQVTVRAICGGLTDTACDGVCVDVQIDPAHCGGCDEPCMEPSGRCVGGQCL